MSSSQASDLSNLFSDRHLTSPYPLYQWTPLSNPSKQIRILTILSFVDSNQIRCTLEEAPLFQESSEARRPPRYKALSYVWGDPEVKKTITIVHGSQLSTLHIAENLFGALTDVQWWGDAGRPIIAAPPDGTELLRL